MPLLNSIKDLRGKTSSEMGLGHIGKCRPVANNDIRKPLMTHTPAIPGPKSLVTEASFIMMVYCTAQQRLLVG